jgi:hypothetical protein
MQMLKSTLATLGLSAIAGAMMLTFMAAPASAFTLASPSLAQPVAAAEVQHVWYDRWGRWHPNYRYGYGYRRCWRGYYGRLHCAW